MRSKPQTRRVSLGVYTISKVGNSKGVNCIKQLENDEFPTEVGDQVEVQKIEDEDGVHIEIHPNDG